MFGWFCMFVFQSIIALNLRNLCQYVAFVQATERFEAIYPTLKEVALGGSAGSKAMKQVALQIFSFAIKAAGESMQT